MSVSGRMSRISAAFTAVLVASFVSATVSATEFDLTQSFSPEDAPSIYGEDGAVMSGTVQDAHGNRVEITVRNRGRTGSRVLKAVSAADGKLLTAFKPDAGGDNMRVSHRGRQGGTAVSELLYRFSAPAGEEFAGDFTVALQMAAWKVFANRSATVQAAYRLGREFEWRSLKTVRAPEGKGARIPAVFDSFGADDGLTFDASGYGMIEVRLTMKSVFFTDTAQLYHARFQGRAVEGNAPVTRRERRRAASRLNLLTDPAKWRRYSAKEKVSLSWPEQGGLRVRTRDDSGRAVYRRALPLTGGRLSVLLHFEDEPGDSTRAGVIVYGVHDDGGRPLTVSVNPEREIMRIGTAETTFRRLPENPYRYELDCVLQDGSAHLYWGGRRMARTPVTFTMPLHTVGIFVRRGTARVATLEATTVAGADEPADKERSYEVLALKAGTDETAPLPSHWQEYWGTHYARAAGREEPDAGTRYTIVRGYAGPHVGIGSRAARADSPARKGPFTGRTVRIGLDDFRPHSKWAKSSDPSALTLIPELMRHDLKAIYGLGMRNRYGPPKCRGVQTFDKDTTYWFLRLFYEKWPEAGNTVIWQVGNEIQGGHWNPKMLTKAQARASRPADIPENRYRSGYDLRWKVPYYVNEWLAPAVATVERLCSELFDDPHALPVAVGSMNPYNGPNAWFLEQVMESRFTGFTAPSVRGDPVWKHFDYLTVHYMFDVGGPSHQFGQNVNRERMDEYVENYLRPGKVRGIWVTEAHGRAGRGPVTILKTGFRFVDWVVSHQLDAAQAKLVWWGEGERAGGSGHEMMRQLGGFLKNRQLRYTRQARPDGVIYVLTDGGKTDSGRLFVCIVPAAGPGYIDVGTVSIDGVATAGQRWRGQAVQYSALALPRTVPDAISVKGRALNVVLKRRVAEPLVLWLEQVPNNAP